MEFRKLHNYYFDQKLVGEIPSGYEELDPMGKAKYWRDEEELNEKCATPIQILEGAEMAIARDAHEKGPGDYIAVTAEKTGRSPSRIYRAIKGASFVWELIKDDDKAIIPSRFETICRLISLRNAVPAWKKLVEQKGIEAARLSTSEVIQAMLDAKLIKPKKAKRGAPKAVKLPRNIMEALTLIASEIMRLKSASPELKEFLVNKCGAAPLTELAPSLGKSEPVPLPQEPAAPSNILDLGGGALATIEDAGIRINHQGKDPRSNILKKRAEVIGYHYEYSNVDKSWLVVPIGGQTLEEVALKIQEFYTGGAAA